MCVIAAGLAVSVPASAQQDDAAPTYSDVTSGVHKPAIEFLAGWGGLGLFDGTLCGNNAFCPGKPIKRSTMAVWLGRVLGGEEPAAIDSSRFADVEDDDWAAPHIERFTELGVTDGCATDPLRYCPDQDVTRAQMATFLVRAFKLDASDPRGFTDIDGDFHEANINALAAANITAGCATDPLRYCPNQDVTRAQMATFLARALGIVQATTPPTTGYTDIAVVGRAACALRADGTVDCWGTTVDSANAGSQTEVLSQDVEIGAPDGTYQELSFAYRTCRVTALKSDGTVECWRLQATYDSSGLNGDMLAGDNEQVRTVSFVVSDSGDVPEGVFIAVDGGCGIRSNGTIACWDNEQLAAGVPQGTFKSVSAASSSACAIRTDATIVCWGHPELSDAPPGTFESADVGQRGGVCAIRASGAIACWGNEQISSSTPEGTFKSVAVGADHACAIRTGGTIACWGNPVRDWLRETFGLDPSEFNPPQGTFTTIDVGFFEPGGGVEGGYNGALRSDGTVSFWGKVVSWDCCG